MNKIWDRKSFEVRGYWPLWRDEKTNDHAEPTKVERKKEVGLAINFAQRWVQMQLPHSPFSWDYHC